MKLPSLWITRNHLVCLFAAAALISNWCGAQAAPQIKSVVPANMETGVSPAASVVFTFTEAMNPSLTTATFTDGTPPYQMLVATAAWSGGNTVLTCSPSPAWPVGHMVVWMVDGENPGGDVLEGDTAGYFIPAGATGTGCDTNAPMLSFTVSKGWSYTQTSANSPALNANYPYCFLACMSLPCPRNATNVTLQLPTGPVQNMLLSSIPGHLTFPDCSIVNQTAFEAFYPSGNYTFNIQAASSNQTVTVNLPPTLTQPAAPHLTNYLAAQSINPAQPFVLGWDPFPGGTAQDCIYVEIYGGVFVTPAVGMLGALNGTVTSVTIPAGTLQPNSQYSGCVTFYHYQMYTNGSSYVSLVYRASTTEFDLHTGAGSTYCPVITNAGWAAAGTFKFEVACPVGQPLVAEWRTNSQAGQWQTLCSTNSVLTKVVFTDPRAAANARMFYRVRTGS